MLTIHGFCFLFLSSLSTSIISTLTPSCSILYFPKHKIIKKSSNQNTPKHLLERSFRRDYLGLSPLKWSELYRKLAKVIHPNTQELFQMPFTGYCHPNTLNLELWLLLEFELVSLVYSLKILDLLTKYCVQCMYELSVS